MRRSYKFLLRPTARQAAALEAYQDRLKAEQWDDSNGSAA